MFFRFLQFSVRWAYRFYFKVIYYTNSSKLPQNEPVIIVANHSNSATDAIFMSAINYPKHVYWLARADAFVGKIKKAIMEYVHTAPIYRTSEFGASAAKKNIDSFDYCFKMLAEEKIIGMFPEGITIHERRLQVPFKKGMARLALQAHDKINRPVYIQPIGVNYRHLAKPQSPVSVIFGEPVSTAPFYEEYKINPNEALHNLTIALEKILSLYTLNYDDIHDQNLLNRLLFMLDNNQKSLGIDHIGIKMANGNIDEFDLVKKILFLQQDSPDILNDLQLSVNQYFDMLKINCIDDCYVQNTWQWWHSLPFQLVLKGVNFLSKVIYYLPNAVVLSFIKAKIKKIEFYTTVRFILSLIVFPLFLTLYGILLKTFFGFSFWLVFISMLTITYLGLIAHHFYMPSYSKISNEILNKLKGLRAEIWAKLKG